MNRDILVLRYLQQQSYETIADQFGKTAHQIRAGAQSTRIVTQTSWSRCRERSRCRKH